MRVKFGVACYLYFTTDTDKGYFESQLEYEHVNRVGGWLNTLCKDLDSFVSTFNDIVDFQSMTAMSKNSRIFNSLDALRKGMATYSLSMPRCFAQIVVVELVKWCVQLTEVARSGHMDSQLRYLGVGDGAARDMMTTVNSAIGDAVVVKKRVDAKAKAKSAVGKPKVEPKSQAKSKDAAKIAANKGVKRDLVAADIGREGEGCVVHDGDGDTRKRAWLDDVQSAVFFALARADATAHIALIKVNFCTNDNFHTEFPAVAAVVHTGVRMSFILAFNSKVVFSGNEHTKWSSLRPVVQKLVLDAAIAHLQSKTVNVVGSSDKLPLEPGHLRSIVNSIDSTNVPLTTPSTKRIDPLSELKACDESALAMVATWADSVHSRQPRLHKEFQNMIESFPDALRSANVSSNHDFVTVCRNVID